ncbi:hypothetical protein EZS27_005096 [termite gut metagenome]|uniref:Uncharacterized protein n=1 Tax=termite gut metagenome TaxID=433724 RepID=A0A5J4SNP9_9ZZZZ
MLRFAVALSLSFESCQIMPDSTVVAFNSEGFCLGL